MNIVAKIYNEYQRCTGFYRLIRHNEQLIWIPCMSTDCFLRINKCEYKYCEELNLTWGGIYYEFEPKDFT